MSSAKFRDEDETPLVLSLCLRENDPVGRDLIARLGPLKKNARLMISVIVANFKTEPDATLFYSRDHNFYSASSTRRYHPSYLTYRATLSAVDALVLAGLVEDIRTPPSPRASKRSRLRATTTLRALLERLPRQAVEHVEQEVIVLRGPSKQLIDYVDTDQTRAMRAEVHAQNAFLRQFAVRLDGVTDVVMWKGQPFDLSFTSYHRIFNGDFEHGGRWYGPAWQNLPKEMRPRLTIDGAATCELDIRSCQPRLLCASAGLTLPFDEPDFDFYRLEPFRRDEVKAAVQILLNAPTARVARGALIVALHKLGVHDAPSRAKRLSKAVRTAWPQFAPYWGTGIGLRLQRVDAEICTRVQVDMRAKGIPVLSIHDGFIVVVDARRSLQMVMQAAMEDACEDLRRHPLPIQSSVKTLKKNV